MVPATHPKTGTQLMAPVFNFQNPSQQQDNAQTLIPLTIQPSTVPFTSFILPQPDPAQRLSLDADKDRDDLLGLMGAGVNDDVNDFAPELGQGLEDDTQPLPSGRRPPPLFVVSAFSQHIALIKASNKSRLQHFYSAHSSFWLP